MKKVGARLRGTGLLMAMAATLVFAGCQQAMLTSQGHIVPQQDRIALAAAGQHSGNWQTRDLSVDYNYEHSQNQLKISGVVHFASYLQKDYQNLAYFNLDTILLNAQGAVIVTKEVTTSNYYASTSQPLQFTNTITLPSGTAAMAFGYTGKARAVGDQEQGGGGTEFSHYPVSTLP